MILDGIVTRSATNGWTPTGAGKFLKNGRGTDNRQRPGVAGTAVPCPYGIVAGSHSGAAAPEEVGGQAEEEENDGGEDVLEGAGVVEGEDDGVGYDGGGG